MSCMEPALKKKREENMDSIEASSPTTHSSQISIVSDERMSPDPFKEELEEAMKTSPGDDVTKDEESIKMASPHPTLPSRFSPIPPPASLDIAGTSKSTEFPPITWKGSHVAELKKGANGFGYSQLPPIKTSVNHTVLFQYVAGKQEIPNPGPDVWDNEHVRMPHSPKSQYPVGDILKSRWEMVVAALQRPITNSRELEEAIMSYNFKYSGRWDFSGLHQFFDEVIEAPEHHCFFTVLLPQMVALALQLPKLITRPLPLLRQHHNHSISLTQMQVACLLANAFFCTFPRRNSAKQASEYASFPDINFNRLFQVQKRKKGNSRTFEKLKCLFHYFRRVCHEAPRGTITFTRKCLHTSNLPVWERSGHYFRKLYISSVGTIEDDGKGMLQVDFANKMVGGGVLGWGCVQEEIRFVICPELIVTRLFTESFDFNEALIVQGCEQYSKYQGYADDFIWDGDFQDTTPHDSSGRMLTTVVAIDALPLRYPSQQFTVSNLVREINKAYVGFSNPDIIMENLGAVATGNWGCGVYRGNAYLKALLQMMAAAQAGRATAYFTFGNVQLQDDVAKMHKFLTERRATVGVIWRHLTQYFDQCYRNGSFSMDLYDYIYQCFDSSYISKKSPSKGRNTAPSTSPAVKGKDSLKKEEKTSPAKAGASKTSQKVPAPPLRSSPRKQRSPGKVTGVAQGRRLAPGTGTEAGRRFPPSQRGPHSSGIKIRAEAKPKGSTNKTEYQENLQMMTERHWDDETGLRGANPGSVQKRIYDYFYELNIPK